jgi:hypothetical protein
MSLIQDTYPQLIGDALRVLEALDPAEVAAMDRRAALVNLVAEVGERNGKTYSRDAIEQAIAQVAPALNTVVSVAQARPVRPSQRERWTARWHTLVRRMKTIPRPQWTLSPVVRFLGQCVGISALVVGVLYVFPWGPAIRAPFVGVIHHTGLFYAGAAFVLLTCLLAGRNAETVAKEMPKRKATKEVIEISASWTALVTGILVAICSVGLGIACIDEDGQWALTNARSVAHDFAQARALPAAKGANFAKIVDLANQIISTDQNNRLGSVDVTDAQNERIGFVMNLNQKECAEMAQLPDNFEVTFVNHVPVQDPSKPLVCEGLWNNRVQIENKPHAL